MHSVASSFGSIARAFLGLFPPLVLRAVGGQGLCVRMHEDGGVDLVCRMGCDVKLLDNHTVQHMW